MQIGQHLFSNTIFLAPMAGVTDQPFRSLCHLFGAGATYTEMTSANTTLRANPKTLLRTNRSDKTGPHIIQIVGADPDDMANAARFNAEKGADIIDINMGCPAKKVCRVAAGSALLSDLDKVKHILNAVTRAVDIPVTLKIRTGPDPKNKNAVTVAQLAEDCGIQALTIHGRTRADRFAGEAEYETIRRVKATLSIPVIANGDINNPEKARDVLAYTQADAIMIGRAAQGNPWIFKEILTFLETGKKRPPPSLEERSRVLLEHLQSLYTFYGPQHGLRIGRKHIAWYCKELPGSARFRNEINKVDNAASQQEMILRFFSTAKNVKKTLQTTTIAA
ncbi:MAG: tRNA dihydrouridine synthase DusB [Gammaproteobacteria bacterium]|nr:tRNA dihydrouridine synthase DusB [Gammaproteobacteria bacterium]